MPRKKHVEGSNGRAHAKEETSALQIRGFLRQLDEFSESVYADLPVMDGSKGEPVDERELFHNILNGGEGRIDKAAVSISNCLPDFHLTKYVVKERLGDIKNALDDLLKTQTLSLPDAHHQSYREKVQGFMLQAENLAKGIPDRPGPGDVGGEPKTPKPRTR